MDRRGRSIVVYFFYAVFIVGIIAAAAMIWPVYRKHKKIKEYVTEVNEELRQKTAEAVELNRIVNDLDCKPEAVEKVAREKFGMTKPGETIFYFKNTLDSRKEKSRSAADLAEPPPEP